MSVKSVLRAGKFMTAKPVVFITGLLTLFIMANAYSLNEKLYIDNLIGPGTPHYSKNGYALKPSGHGYCMYGVYHPASCTVRYETKVKYVTLHYNASLKHWCVLKHSSQDFNIINNDTGKIVATLQWYTDEGKPFIKNIKDPENIMEDLTDKYERYSVKNKLNIYAHK